MPALSSFTATSTDASKNTPSINNNFSLQVNGASSAETAAVSSTTVTDLHYNYSIPVGQFGFLANHSYVDISASPSSSILTIIGGIYVGTGSGVAFTGRFVNPQPATTYTPNNGTKYGHISILKGANLKHVASGF